MEFLSIYPFCHLGWQEAEHLEDCASVSGRGSACVCECDRTRSQGCTPV